MIEVTVARLGLDSATNSYVVILRERHGRRILPIWIGQPEAESIVMQMNQFTRERPLTHDLCKSLIVGLGGTLRRVTITKVQKGTYYAELQIDGPNGIIDIDARPSDSIAVALRLNAPIFAPALLLTAVDTDDDVVIDDQLSINTDASELTAEQLKAYLENLRPEDFGKFSP
jgi:bifunctional DNase/RNase